MAIAHLGDLGSGGLLSFLRPGTLGVRAGVASHSLSLYLVAWVWGMLPVSPGCDHVLLGCHPSCSHPTRLSHTLCLMRKRVSFGTTGYLAAAQGDNGAAELWDERCEGSMCIAGAHTAMSEPNQSHSPPLPGPGSRSSKPCVSPKTASGAAGRKGSTAGLGDVLMGRGVAPAGLGTKAGPALPDMGLCAGLCQGTSLRDSGALSWGGWPPRQSWIGLGLCWGLGGFWQPLKRQKNKETNLPQRNPL